MHKGQILTRLRGIGEESDRHAEEKKKIFHETSFVIKR